MKQEGEKKKKRKFPAELANRTAGQFGMVLWVSHWGGRIVHPNPGALCCARGSAELHYSHGPWATLRFTPLLGKSLIITNTVIPLASTDST